VKHLVEIEVPRGGFVKRKADGGVDFVSPLPCPFNYGSVPDTTSGDGDPLDAVVLGPRLSRGALVERAELAVVDFVDAGDPDPKLICGDGPLTKEDLQRVVRFFSVYAWAKRKLNRARGKAGITEYRGVTVGGPRG